jgi:5-methylcytosine-specific restriction endonuclease McrA
VSVAWCEHATVTRRTNGPHLEEVCADCARHLRFVSKAEAGVGRRSVTSRKGVKPRARARVLERFGYGCYLCGRSATDGVLLHVDHILPVDLAKRFGVYDDVIESELNLAPLCEECNLGKGAEVFGAGAVRLMAKTLRVWSQLQAERAERVAKR